MLEVQWTYTDGTTVPDGHAVLPDHYVDTFTVKVSSMGGLTAKDIMSLLQTRHEVKSVSHTNQTVIIRK